MPQKFVKRGLKASTVPTRIYRKRILPNPPNIARNCVHKNRQQGRPLAICWEIESKYIFFYMKSASCIYSANSHPLKQSMATDNESHRMSNKGSKERKQVSTTGEQI